MKYAIIETIVSDLFRIVLAVSLGVGTVVAIVTSFVWWLFYKGIYIL